MLESLGEDNIMIKKSFICDTSLEMVLEVHILSYTEMQWEEYVSERINIERNLWNIQRTEIKYILLELKFLYQTSKHWMWRLGQNL